MSQAAGVVMSVVAHRVRTADPPHEATHLPVDQRSQDEVIVIAHQYPRMEDPVVEVDHLLKCLDEESSVAIVVEHRPPLVPTSGDVPNRTRVFETQCS